MQTTLKLPVHQPDVYNIDRALNWGGWTWKCAGNRISREDAIETAKKWADQTGDEHRVMAPTGKVIFTTED